MSTVISLKNLVKKKDQIKKLSETSTMSLIGEKVLELNTEQIESGVDQNNRKFKPYSESYKKQIMAAKSRISGKGRWKGGGKSKARLGAKDPNEVNLTVTGSMLADFGIVKVKKGEVVIGFHSIKQKQKAEGNVKKRQFVGLTKKNYSNLFSWIKKTFLGK